MKNLIKFIAICAGFALLVVALLATGFSLSREVNNEIISSISEVTGKPNSASTSTPEPSPSYYYGKISWVGNELCGNKPCKTKSGEWFDENKFTCACGEEFPLGTRLIVSYEENSVEVVCNDRAKFQERTRRILDLSKAAFEALAPDSKGVVWARVREVRRK